MPARPSSPRSSRSSQSRPESCLYLGCFIFDVPGERERTGSFQIVVAATSPEEAVEGCQRRLRNIRTTTTLFDEPTTIYIESIIKLAGSYEKGLLVNYESGDRAEGPDIRITCTIPEQKDHEAIDYGWRPEGHKKKGTNDDSETLEPFLDFGGERFRKAVEKKKGDPSTPGSSPRGAPPPTTSVDTTNGPGSKDAKRKLQVQAARRKVISATLEEIRDLKRPSDETGITRKKRRT